MDSIQQADQKDKRLIYIKDKHGVYFVDPLNDKNSKILSVSNASVIKNSGNFTAIISETKKVFIYDNKTLKLLKELEHELISQIEFSPTNKYLTIIQKPSINNNLKIISLEDFSVKAAFHSTSHPNFDWPQIKFSPKEDYIFKKTNKTQLEIYKFQMNKEGEEKEEVKTVDELKHGTIQGVIDYEISEIITEQVNEIALICGRVVLDEKTKKKKSFVTFYKVSDLSKPIKEMNVSICDRMNIKVSPDKKYVILQSICDDTTSTSYYGESSLYYLDLLYGKFLKIALTEGPIHDFQWTPNALHFIVCAGHQPAKVNLYTNAAKLVKEITTSKVNTIEVSPDSRVLCLAGFGNLNGDMEFYKLSDLSVIGKTNFYCGVTLKWSADSKYLLGAVLSPRIRVDNEYRIFTYNGEEVMQEKFNVEVYGSDWIENDDIRSNYVEYKIEVSPEYLKKKCSEKQAKKVNSISSAFKNLDMNYMGDKNKSIPGMMKKK